VRPIARVSLLCVLLVLPGPFLAQSPTGTVSGQVLDPDGRAIAGAEILVVNDLTGVQYAGKSNEDGIYVVADLPPGPYRIQVSKIGFKAIIKPGIILNVQDALSVNFKLPIGAASIVVTVPGGVPLVNTQSAAVSTVVDRNFIENMPLNGRSFQDLILLTPGVATASPQAGSVVGEGGEFSVNGQRTESNYYTVDGVSANTGVSSVAPGVGASGSLGASTALGTTQALVSVDALEEFRVQSSTYSAEYGRTPGGQFALVTRSGTNEWHGTLFDYLRNDVFDANNWFNDYYQVPESPLRQNDFGGTLGGPVVIPRVYQGRNKTFFFFSYEGLRSAQPQAATVNYVPDAALRQSAPRSLQPVLNAFPVANGADLGNGLAEFIGTWSNPSSIDAYSFRLDHTFSDKVKAFFRFSDAPSSQGTRGIAANGQAPSMAIGLNYGSRSYTAVATAALSPQLSNEFRLNYTSNSSAQTNQITSYGGGRAIDLAQLQGINPASGSYQVGVNLNIGGYFSGLSQGRVSGLQRQWNLVDTVGMSLGRHEVKLGFDYRRLAPVNKSYGPYDAYFFFSGDAVKSNSVDELLAIDFRDAYPLYTNFSAFVQDEWRVTSRLNLAVGLRWELNPAPGAKDGNLPYTVVGTSLTTLSLAPQGTALWDTSWHNVAPRLGAIYQLRNSPGFETVLRGGGGVFFDTAQQLGSYGYSGPGFSAFSFSGSAFDSPASFPVPVADAEPSITVPPVPPYGTVFAFPRHLQLPYTLEWNAAIEQALGKSQAFTVSYVGSHGAKLLEENEVNAQAFNPNFSYVLFLQNGVTSDYNALQLQFRRRLSGGLTALASYTWAHSIDYQSQNYAFPAQRGNSDFDVRHDFSGAASYDIPKVFHSRILGKLFGDWGIDDRFTVRTAFPVTLSGGTIIDPATGRAFNGGLDRVEGVPVYTYGSQYPGGRAINSNAFTEPPPGALGDAPRNFVRGFGALQMDLAIRREFPLFERLKLQFRAEAFNAFNRPNFGYIDPTYGENTFGQATATLNSSLGILSPLYQTGGPRSMQFALKLAF
jgi:hypothetical protein